MTTTEKVDDTRVAVCWLNYAGRAALNPHHSVGPTTWGETLWPVEVTYDPVTNTSRIGFSYIAPTAGEQTP